VASAQNQIALPHAGKFAAVEKIAREHAGKVVLLESKKAQPNTGRLALANAE